MCACNFTNGPLCFKSFNIDLWQNFEENLELFYVFILYNILYTFICKNIWFRDVNERVIRHWMLQYKCNMSVIVRALRFVRTRSVVSALGRLTALFPCAGVDFRYKNKLLGKLSRQPSYLYAIYLDNIRYSLLVSRFAIIL